MATLGPNRNASPAKQPKYGNRKVTIGGQTFDSTREYERFKKLRLLERAGQIDTLTRQPKFTLLPSQRNADGKVERPVVYVGDFMYREDGKFVVEDAKGLRTRDYIIKRKLMLERHGITVRET